MNKRGLELEVLGKWIIGLVVLVIVILAILVLSGKGQGAIEFLKNFLRFGR